MKKHILNSDGSNTILSNVERTRTSFSTIERTLTCSSIGDQTRTSYFPLWTNKHRTSNLIWLSLDLLNYLSNWLEHHFLNIKQTKMSIGNRTQTTYFWFRTIGHWTSNIVRPITKWWLVTKISVNRAWTWFHGLPFAWNAKYENDNFPNFSWFRERN